MANFAGAELSRTIRRVFSFVREAVAVALRQAARIGVGRAREIFERLEQNVAAPVTH